MPFEFPPRTATRGDLIYGVHSDKGRKAYLKTIFKNVGLLTIDQFKVLPAGMDNGTKTDDGLMNVIAIHQKYKSLQDVDSLGNTNEAVRRKCKAGLEWCVTYDKHIHFVLDDLDINAVIGKNYTGKSNSDRDADAHNPKNRSVTGAELRWIYRNRHRTEVQKHIQFWNDKGPCSPPWEEDVKDASGTVVYSKNDWAGYIPKPKPGDPDLS